MNPKALCSFLILFVLLHIEASAQPGKIKFRDRLGDTTQVVNTAPKAPKVPQPKALRSEWSVGLKLATDGYGLVFDYGRAFGSDKFGTHNSAKFFHNHIFQLEITERKHPKEIRSSNLVGSINIGQGSFILGKINNFYQAKLGYGQRRMIAGKPDPGTVSIHWTYLGGFSIGLLKPYYLDIIGKGMIKFTPENEQYYAMPHDIMGAGGIGKGWGELKLVPGLYAKSGLHFDYAHGRKNKMSVEVGVGTEYYFSKIQQVYGQDEKSLFFNLYGIIQFGRRN
jgi:hypothetical protein